MQRMACIGASGKLVLAVCLLSSCDSSELLDPSAGSAGSHEAGDDAGTDTNVTALKSLSLHEAPPPTRTFYWGEGPVSAPGFAVPARDTLTIALAADNQVRYLSWKSLVSLPKVFGDGPQEFPLAGTRNIDLHPEFNSSYDVTVEDNPKPTVSHFLFGIRVVSDARSDDKGSDYRERIEGTRVRDGDPWDVVYTEKGRFRSAKVDARGDARLYTRDPNVVSVVASRGSFWKAPVELTAPGFFGPPVDHLRVALDAQGQLKSFGFERFARSEVTFGAEPADVPLSGATLRNAFEIAVDDAVEPTTDHFVLRYHAKGGPEGISDYVEGLDGTRSGDTLLIRYFIKGKLRGAAIDAHAAGTLVPAAN
ncbi:MAG: hypothetical protein RL701_2751 [Pseudomonadota bacterium]